MKNHEKFRKFVDCDKCPYKFEEPLEENWECLGIIEKYGVDIFINTQHGMGGTTWSVNTTAITDILKAEGKEGKEFNILFHDFCVFFQAGIGQLHKNTKEELKRRKKK